MIELKDFIAQALVQVAKGIEQANQALEGTDAAVVPKNACVNQANSRDALYGWIEPKEKFKRTVYAIDFDVAVTAQEGKGTKGGIGIVIGAIGLGSQGQSDQKSEVISRIRFKIPMTYPEK